MEVLEQSYHDFPGKIGFLTGGLTGFRSMADDEVST
jgi:hypothetical protein